MTRVHVIGTGLLGTSLGLALRRVGEDVTLEDISPTHAALARDLGAGRLAEGPVEDDAGIDPDLVVVAAPPDVTAAVVAGALLQKALGNPSVAGVSPVGALGLVTTVAGLVAPIGLPGRAALAAGGLAYLAGATLYNQVAPPNQGTP